MKIVVLDSCLVNPGDLAWDGIAAMGQLVVHKDTPMDKLAETIGDAEVVLDNRLDLSGQVIEACPGLKYIGLSSTGYNHVDTETAKKRGIVVTNVPGYSTAGVAQHAIALMLALTNQVAAHSANVKAGAWLNREATMIWDHPITGLAGKTFGVLGFGNIGRAAGRTAKALGMRVLASGSRPTPEGQAIAEAYVDLDTLLAESDVLSLHCPLMPQTAGVINAVNIAKMKDGAFLVNASRGRLVVEQDLADALNSGKLAGAGLDVTVAEPPPMTNPLLSAKNCFITPHAAWTDYGSRKSLMDQVEANLRAWLEGGSLNVVNP